MPRATATTMTTTAESPLSLLLERRMLRGRGGGSATSNQNNGNADKLPFVLLLVLFVLVIFCGCFLTLVKKFLIRRGFLREDDEEEYNDNVATAASIDVSERSTASSKERLEYVRRMLKSRVKVTPSKTSDKTSDNAPTTTTMPSSMEADKDGSTATPPLTTTAMILPGRRRFSGSGDASKLTDDILQGMDDLLLTDEATDLCCAICLAEFSQNDDICLSNNSNCPHSFHSECMISWLMKRDDCPCCRQAYLEDGRANQDESANDDGNEGQDEDPVNPEEPVNDSHDQSNEAATTTANESDVPENGVPLDGIPKRDIPGDASPDSGLPETVGAPTEDENARLSDVEALSTTTIPNANGAPAHEPQNENDNANAPIVVCERRQDNDENDDVEV